MQLISEPMAGVKILKPFVFEDERGGFVKTFHECQLTAHGIQMEVKEEFYSTSAKGVLRGMHFQIPPHDHQKLIYCIKGKVLDVLLDLRKESLTFGMAVGMDLSEHNKHVLFVPRGVAHGFLSLEADTCLVYKTDAVYFKDSDMGIHWDSFNFDWTVHKPVMSERDQLHPPFHEFVSPF